MARPPLKGGHSGPSIIDVARLAGVSDSTVSRALTQPGRIAEKTRRKVMEAAEELGYRPNLAARTLRSGASKTIMIVLPGELFSGASQVINEVLRGLDATLFADGYSLLIANLDREEKTERHILNLALSGTIAGAVIMASQIPKADGRTLLDVGLPVASVLVDLTKDGVSSVVSNDRTAMAQAARHLIALGHRRFFYISGPDGNYHEQERSAGLKQALSDAGLGDGLIAWPGDFNFPSGVAAAQHYLTLENRPTGVLACNDDMAISFAKTVADAGMRIPQDVSVIGFDGAEVGAFMIPALASIRQQTHLLGSKVAKLILAEIAGEAPADPVREEILCQLIERDSVTSQTPATL